MKVSKLIMMLQFYEQTYGEELEVKVETCEMEYDNRPEKGYEFDDPILKMRTISDSNIVLEIF